MKSIIFMSALLATIGSNVLYAETVKLDSEEAKVNYSVGYQVGGDFKRQKIEMDEAAFLQGLRDSLAEKTPAMTEHEMRTTLVGLKKRIMEGQRKEMVEQAKVNTEKGAAYLAENEKKEGVKVLPSGLQYRVIKEGEGKSPTDIDKVSVHYTGTLIDGTVFDSSRKRGKPAEFQVNRVIKGWIEGLKLMQEGSQFELVIPSDLAYGSKGAGKKIPPNSTLVFDVELLSVLNPEENKKP